MVAAKRMPYSGCKQAQVGSCKSALVRLGLVWGSIPIFMKMNLLISDGFVDFPLLNGA